MAQKIGMFVLVAFALIALIRQPETVASFVASIGLLLRSLVDAFANLFNSVQG